MSLETTKQGRRKEAERGDREDEKKKEGGKGRKNQ